MRRRVSDDELLEGLRVLIIAVLPMSDEISDARSVLEAEEALISTIRAVLAEGGTVELVADAGLALLGAVVAGEYFEPEAAEQGVDKPRSERPERPGAPLVRIHELASVADGALDPFARSGAADVFAPEELVQMVERMAPSQAALICVGEAPMLDCVDAFRRHNAWAPVFTYASSGREAAALVESRSAVAVDLEIGREEPPRSRRRESEERQFPSDRHQPEWDLPVDAEFQFSPMPLIAQLIVRRIRRPG